MPLAPFRSSPQAELRIEDTCDMNSSNIDWICCRQGEIRSSKIRDKSPNGGHDEPWLRWLGC